MSEQRWPTIPGFVQIAILGKTKGIEGAVRVKVKDQFLEQVVSQEFLFVDINGSKVPMAVEGFDTAGGLFVYFEGLETKEQAARVVGRGVYVPEDQFVPVEEPDSQLRFNYMTGYTIVSGDLTVGVIKEVREFPQQEIAVVIRGSDEIMIPLHEDLIRQEDRDKRLVEMELPEGLLDI